MAQVVVGNRSAYKLTPEMFQEFWPKISSQLDRIPQYWAPWWTKESIYNGVLAARFQAWGVGPEGELRVLLLTQICSYPAATILNCFLMLGQDDELESSFEALEPMLLRFAEIAGCTLAEVNGRIGFKRALKKFGFVQNSVVLSRAITERVH